METLPEECISQVISFTSPTDACQLSLVASWFRDAAESDLVWEKFLPPDYCEIISRSVYPVKFSSKKNLFRQLSSTPLIIDGGKKSFSVEKHTGKKCYMLSARELSIIWSTNPLSWCWKCLASSRFPEAVELVMVDWLEIRGNTETTMLSPNTTYGAYLVVKIVNRAFGLHTLASKISLDVGDYKSQGRVYVKHNVCRKEGLGAPQQEHERVPRVPRVRGDGWLEIELGEFYNHDEAHKEVKMSFRETKGVQLKGGLVVEGIELRPKEYTLVGI